MNFFLEITTLSVILPVLIGGIRFINLGDRLKGMVLFLLFTLLVECVAIYKLHHKVSTQNLYNAYTLIEYGFFANFYRTLIRNKMIRQLVIFSIPVFTAISAYYLVFFVKDINASAMLVVESVLMILWVLVYFYELFTAEYLVRLSTEPSFWISTGVLIYFGGSFFFEGFYSYLQAHPELSQFEAILYHTSNLLMYLLFSIGLLCPRIHRKLT